MPTFEPGILTRIRRRRMEVQFCAEDLARQGYEGEKGDPLPDYISGECHDWINNNIRAFKALVARAHREATP